MSRNRRILTILAAVSTTLVAACGVDRAPLFDRADASVAGFGGSGGIGGVGGIGGIGGVGGVGGVGGIGGIGGVGGVGGAGGFGGVGGSGGFGGVGGSGGVGGGVGGSGGSVDPFACVSSNDIRTGHECAEAAEGWFAIKTMLDVWWKGISTRDPGRGAIDIYLLGKLENTCSDGSNARVTIKACGTRLPPFTSDVACDAFQIEFPDEMWESPRMPRFITTANTNGFDPGAILTINQATGLIGIDLMDGAEQGVWPTSAQTRSVACEAGQARACFPDHDNDGLDGVTIRLRTDEAIYTSPYQNGACTNMAIPYKYRGAPTGLNLAAGGGAGGGVRAARVQIGLRTRLSGRGEIRSDCASGTGPSTADFLDSRALACAVSPSSLPVGTVGNPLDPPDPRIASRNYACSDMESQFVDDNVPVYQVLQAGQSPGDSGRPNGWLFAGRDIPKHASIGPKSALIRLGSLEDAEPSCATVREITYPSL